MKQDYINKIKNACVKANPEIMELKFGCETSEGIFLRQDDKKGYFYTEQNLNIISKKDYKILGINGRPIQLSDVLLAIENKSWLESNELYHEIVHKILKHWNLKEPLENQSEETLKFIANIISNLD